MIYSRLHSWFPDGHERRWTSTHVMAESVRGKGWSHGDCAARDDTRSSRRGPVFQNALILQNCSSQLQGAGVRAIEGDHHADMEEKSLLTVTNVRQTAVTMSARPLLRHRCHTDQTLHPGANRHPAFRVASMPSTFRISTMSLLCKRL